MRLGIENDLETEYDNNCVEVNGMDYRETEFKLKDGRDALLRSPCEEDAEEMLQFIIKA